MSKPRDYERLRRREKARRAHSNGLSVLGGKAPTEPMKARPAAGRGTTAPWEIPVGVGQAARVIRTDNGT